MKIWVDADACPAVIKDILFRAAERTRVQLTLVANRAVPIPPSRYIDMVQVRSGFDAADNEIVKRLGRGDLVITSDIPLASEVINKGGYALNPRGELYTTDNIKERLNMRDFLTTLRASGVQTGGPSTLSQSDRKYFANQFDQFLTKHLKDS
jgi:uncharacterized protein YaiI (UPF0178 family)